MAAADDNEIKPCRERLNSDGFMDLELEESKAEFTVPRPEPRPKQRSSMIINPDEQSNLGNITEIVIEEDYILSSHLGDWENLYNQYTFSAD